MPGDKEMVIFTRTFDFISWLLPATNNFPRAHRHTFTSFPPHPTSPHRD
jgi:hypothetical protein